MSVSWHQLQSVLHKTQTKRFTGKRMLWAGSGVLSYARTEATATMTQLARLLLPQFRSIRRDSFKARIAAC